MTFTGYELELKENKIASANLGQIVQDQNDAEKHHQSKEKMQEMDSASYLIDRLLEVYGASRTVETPLEHFCPQNY